MRLILAGCVVFLMTSVADEMASAQTDHSSFADSTVTMQQKNQQVIAATLAILGTALDASQWGKTYRSLCFFGAGHFLQEDWLTGAGFLAGEASLLVLRNNLAGKVGSTDRFQYPYISDNLEFQREGRSSSSYADLISASSTDLLLGDLNWVDMYTAFRTAHDKTSATNKVDFHDDGVAGLFLSPFKLKYITNPWVFVPVIAGCAAAAASTLHDRHLSSVSSLVMFNRTFSPFQAAVFQSGGTAPRFLMVATGEEMFFRGMLQTELTELFNPVIAVGASSIVFGLAHVGNGGLYWVTPTLLGLYLGYRYQANGYDLGETIATHFWFDWLGQVIEIVCDPRDSEFVYSISWKF